MNKTTAKIPKSRSKYLMQFLKRKIEFSEEKPTINRDKCVTIYSSISGGPHRRGNSTQFSSQIGNNQEQTWYDGGEFVEDEKIYQTPKNYATRRRIKKKERYEDIEEPGFSVVSKHLAFESTECTREATELARARHDRRREIMKLNASLERVQQVHIDDESIDDIDEDEECASIPSEEKNKREVHNKFYHKINQASLHQPGDRHDPYTLLFDQDLSINKMIDEILTNDHRMKFSGSHENIWQEEMKEEMSYDIELEDDGDMQMTPEFNIDDVVTSIREPICNSPINRNQKRSFKYLNKFQNIKRSKEFLWDQNSPKTQKKRLSNFKLKCIEPKSTLKRSELIKGVARNEKRVSNSRQNKNQIKSKCNIDPTTDRLLRTFYNLLSDQVNKQKLLEQFKTTGKGGTIELEGEPIFPLKMTLDYLLQNYQGCTFNIITTKARDSQNKFESPIRRVFKESKNINNAQGNSTYAKTIEVEGRVTSGCEDKGAFKHCFEIKNNLITRLVVSP